MAPEDQDLADTIARMERIRALLKRAGDLVMLAQVNAWFRQHAPAIRRVRDLMEAAEFEGE